MQRSRAVYSRNILNAGAYLCVQGISEIKSWLRIARSGDLKEEFEGLWFYMLSCQELDEKMPTVCLLIRYKATAGS